jgi:hypothetical protein
MGADWESSFGPFHHQERATGTKGTGGWMGPTGSLEAATTKSSFPAGNRTPQY